MFSIKQFSFYAEKPNDNDKNTILDFLDEVASYH